MFAMYWFKNLFSLSSKPLSDPYLKFPAMIKIDQLGVFFFQSLDTGNQIFYWPKIKTPF